MPTRLSGLEFEDFLVTSPGGIWTPSTRWDESQFHSFLNLRSGSQNLLDSPPQVYRKDKRPEAKIASRWLFVEKDEQTLAWAELQAFPRKHDRYGIIFVSMPTLDLEAQRKDLAHLFSFVFLLGRFDHIRFIPMEGTLALMRSLELWVGEEKQLLSFAPSAWRPQLRPSVSAPILDISRQAWLNLEETQSSLRALQHVKHRIERFEQMQKPTKQQKRRSFLARLLRPRIDDSLF